MIFLENKTTKVINDMYFCSSVIDELNEIIEEELKKDALADLDLIDDCCAALEILNGNVYNEKVLVSCFNALQIIKKYNSERSKRILLSASCLVLISAIAATAALTRDKPKTEQGEFLSAKASESVVSEAIEDTTKKTGSTTRMTQVKQLKVMQPLGESKMVFDNREEINIEDFYFYVEYLDGRRYSVPSSECSFEVLETEEDGATRVKVTYSGYEAFIYVTVRMPEVYTTEYYYPDCDCDDDVFDDDFMFTEDETSATMEETIAEEETSETGAY